MSPHTVFIIFQFAVLIFAFCVHEAAHAWTASRLGDQTARMLGRVTLNPAKHIDPLGSIIFPLIGAFYGGFLIGWAKPTPVTPRNFKHYTRDDILVTIAGPLSNLLMALVALIILIAVKHTSHGLPALAAALAFTEGQADAMTGGSILVPLLLFLYVSILINLLLFVFNLFPIPPLDGSRVLIHFLPYRVQETYNRLGGWALILLFLFGGRFIDMFYSPLLAIFQTALFRL
ncbi:MAG: site-2 protease family protein [Acidobacteria bacterium]|nr:site-2 protease family protein [Acidobacteriota bacterium]